MTIDDGKIVMANPDDKGQAELVADTDGQGKVRIDGQYLGQVLKACGGMVDFKLTNAYSPMLFASNGYQQVVMPMLTSEANEQAQKDRQAKAEQAEPKATATFEVKDDTGKVPEPVAPVAEQKPKRNRKRKQTVVAK